MNVLDLFCGAAGGWSAGLVRAGYRIVAACEVDEWRRGVFAASHPGCRMYPDVRELTAERIGNDLGFLPDVVVGSPPCQEISAANTKGTGITDDHLFWDFARIVFEVRPIWCAAENSPRARAAGIDGILAALDQAAYASWASVVGAVHAGANHERRRLWLVAADALRLELRQQSGGGRRSNGRGAPIAGDVSEHAAGDAGLRLGGVRQRHRDQPAQADLHDPDANGRLAGDPRRHALRCVELGARQDGDDPRDADSRAQNTLGGFRCWPETQRAGADPDPDRAGLALGPRLGSDDGAELPAALRDIGLAWPHWNGGIAGLSAACAAAGFGAVDDGANPFLAPSLRNRAISALGDAVLPQIPEAIGRAMWELI